MKKTIFQIITALCFTLFVTVTSDAQNLGNWSGTPTSAVSINGTQNLDYALSIGYPNGVSEMFAAGGGLLVKGNVRVENNDIVVDRGAASVRASTTSALTFKSGYGQGDNNTFEVLGSGQIHSWKGLKIYAGQAYSEPIEVKQDEGGPDVFHVKNSGQVVSWNGYTVVDGENSNECVFLVDESGKVWATEVEVGLPGFCDYVFEDDYNLMSLKDLNSYIQDNKHLPNIPSAKEVDENGIGLGKLSHLQMEKIEELTLYILDLDKRLERLEKENSTLKNELSKSNSK